MSSLHRLLPFAFAALGLVGVLAVSPATVYAQTPPPAPASINVPVSSVTGNYWVTWASSTGATGYELQEDTVATFATAGTIYLGPNTQYYVTGKSSGTFYYRVRASNASGNSGWTVGLNSCQIVPPAQPATINVPVTSPGTHTISWSSASGTTAYELEEDTSAFFTSPTVVYYAGSTAVSLTRASGTFYYRVRATNGAGSSNWTVGSTGCTITAPAQPSLINVPSSSTGSYSVSWSGSTGATSYELDEDTTGAFTSPVTVYTGTGTSRSFSKTTGTYWYRVRAGNAVGTSNYTVTTNGCTIVAPPAPATINVPSTTASSSISVSWSWVSGATGYDLEEDSSASFTNPVQVYSGSSTGYSVGGKTTGTFYYRVRATNAAGQSGWTTGANGCTIVAPATPASINVPTTTVTTSIYVSWSSTTGATSYTLEEDSSASFTSPTQVYAGSSTGFSVTGKTPGTYYYRVQASNAVGSSGWRTGVNGCTLVAPNAPSTINVPSTTAGSSIYVNWSGASGATSYDLEEDTSASFTNPTLIYSGTSTGFSSTGKTSGTFYYRVRASNAVGSSAWTQGVNGCTIVAPSPPASINVPATTVTTTIYVSWSGVSGTTSYDLEEDTSSSFTSPVQVYSGTSTGFSVTGKTPGTYYYRVRANNAVGSSAWTQGVNGCTLVAPLAPASLSVPTTSSTTSIYLSWSSASGATAYVLEEDVSSSFTSPVTVYNGSNRTFTVTGKTSGTFYYRVCASNAVGASPWTAGANGCIIVPPLAPSAISVPVTNVTGSYTVSWNGVSGASSYTLEEDSQSSFATSSVIYNGMSSSFAVTGKTTGTFYYRVRASSGAGSSPWTSGANGCTRVAPAAPANINVPATSSTGSISLSWSSSSGTTGYDLEEDTAASFATATAVYSGTSTSVTLTGRANGTYYYRVRATNPAGASTWTAGSLACTVTLPPLAPASVTVPPTSVTGAYAVSWTSSATAASYDLQEANNASFTGATTIYQGAATSFNITGKTTGTWYYRVRAVNSGGASTWMSATNGCQIVPPAAPASITVPATSATGAYALSWAASTGAAAYDLQEDTSSLFSSANTIYSGTNTTFGVTGKANGTYYYRVRATSLAGNSVWLSGTNGCVVLLPPPAPSGITVPATATGTFTVSWSAAATAASYDLEEDSNPAFPAPALVYQGPNTSCPVAGKSTGTWYYRVRAVNASGSGPWAAGVNGCLLPPPAPGSVTLPATSVTGSYTVQWTAAPSAATYDLEEDTDAAFTNPVTAYSGAALSFGVAGKVAGTFEYRVRAVNAAGPGPWTPAANGCTIVAPAAPASLAVPATSDTGTFTVSWAGSLGASAYEVEEDTDSAFTGPVTVFSGSASAFDVTGKWSGTFYYRVRAANGAGASPWTAAANGCAIVAPASPAPIVVPAASATGSYVVSWTDLAGARLFELEEDADSAFTNPRLVSSGPDAYTRVWARPDGTYYYRVRAVNGAGPGPWAVDTAGCLVALAVPDASASISVPASSHTGHYELSWTAVPGAGLYEVEEDTQSAFGHPVVVYSGARASCSVSSRANGLYFYRVRAANDAGTGPWTAGLNGCSVNLTAPGAPASLSLPTTSPTGIVPLRWTLGNYATLYELQEATDAAFTDAVAIFAGPALAFDAAGRTAGTYHYRVRSLNAVGVSDWTLGDAPCTVSPVSAALLARAGAFNPGPSAERPGAAGVPMLQIELVAGAAQDVRVLSLAFSSSGSGSETAHLAGVTLCRDLDGDGVAGAEDLVVATTAFADDDGTLLFDLSQESPVPAGGAHRYLVLYDFALLTPSGSDFSLRFDPSGGCTARETSTTLPVSPIGSAFDGGTKTVATAAPGSLAVAAGANNPVGGVVVPGLGGTAAVQVRLSASSLEDVEVSAVRFLTAGTGNEAAGIVARLLLDTDGDGRPSPSDADLGAAAFGTDNGSVEFEGIAVTVPAGNALHLVLSLEFPHDAAPGSYVAFLPCDTAVAAAGAETRAGLDVTGAPVAGGVLTVEPREETAGAATFLGGCAAGRSAPGGWAGLLLLAAALLSALGAARRRAAAPRPAPARARPLLVLACVVALAGVARAGEPVTVAGLLEGHDWLAPVPHGPVQAALRPVLQDSGWGTEEVPTPPAGPEEKPADPGGSSWGDDGWEKAPVLPEDEIRARSEKEPLPGGKGTGTRLRIGLELGGFLPFGARDATFATGQVAGLVFGFDLTGTSRTPRISAAVRLREGTTVSADQESGYDVRSTLILFAGEILLHLFPNRETSDVRLFLGLGGIVESFRGLRRDPLTGRETEETGTDGTLSVDLGFEGLLALGGPVDLVFRMEFDVLPLANNVTFFIVAAAGLQLRF